MEFRTCDHLKEDGVYCNSPALRGRDYCYFHLNLRGRRLKAARARDLGPRLGVPHPFAGSAKGWEHGVCSAS